MAKTPTPARMMNPGEDIAAQVRAGTMDAADALAAVADLTADTLGLDDQPLDAEAAALAEADAERAAKAAEEDRRLRLNALGHRLLQEAQTQVQLRQSTEERWYQDVRQFNGIYEPGMFADTDDGRPAYGSRVFVQLTRRLVGLCEARLYDMLFQAGERYYTFKPTPVPELAEADTLSGELAPDTPVTIDGQPVPVGDVAAAVKAVVQEAQRAADAMQREVDDQLAECKFAIHARNAIHDAALLGTGVMKGPTVLYKTAKRWIRTADGGYTLQLERRPVPVVARVDPWNFFPDMSATTIEEAEFVFERHFLTKKQVGALKDMEAVDLDALRQVLGNEPNVTGSNHREKLRSINGAAGAPDKRYEVWEYHGPLSAQDLLDCGCPDIDAEDPLAQYTGVVFFCDGVVLKAALAPLDTGELPYRVFCWQKDESSIFGFGLPYEVRDSQVSANAAFRAALDQMGLTVKPQVVVDDGGVEPINGAWDIEPGKFWRKKRNAGASAPIQFIDIPSRLPELQSIFAAAKGLIEEVGTMPAFMQGQEAPAAMQSATGSSIAWTAANLWVRRCVRNWDDDIITPTMGGFYDWNMQWNPKAELKGDCQVQALGTTSLVELEGQAQRIKDFVMAAKAMGVPLPDQLMMLRQYARGLKLDPDLVLPSEQEIEKLRQTQGASQPSIEQQQLEVTRQNNEMDAQTAMAQQQAKGLEIQQRERDGQRRERMLMAQLSAETGLSLQELEKKYGLQATKIEIDRQERAADRQHEAQMLNAEIQTRVMTGAGV